MGSILALSDAVQLGLLGIVGTTMTAASAIAVAKITTDARERDMTSRSITLAAAEELDRARADRERAERREARCLSALEWAYGAIAALQAATGVHPIGPPPDLHAREDDDDT